MCKTGNVKNAKFTPSKKLPRGTSGTITGTRSKAKRPVARQTIKVVRKAKRATILKPKK